MNRRGRPRSVPVEKVISTIMSYKGEIVLPKSVSNHLNLKLCI